ncbi:TPA: 50S ribosomal protein L32 [Patescibacteria group bacterium]|nr:50S ribosomal protein L32 [Candidatus Gracilibacteria bacterium]
MTIGPKKKVSKTQSRTRHSTWETINLKKISNTYKVSTCKNCGAKKLAYKVCPVCGYYKGKQVITIKSKGNEKVIDA